MKVYVVTHDVPSSVEKVFLHKKDAIMFCLKNSGALLGTYEYEEYEVEK